MMTNSKVELKRVNMNLPANLVERVKQYGESLGINTTNAYIVLLNQALDQKESLNMLPELLSVYKDAFNMLVNNNSSNVNLDEVKENIKLIDNNSSDDN